VLIESLAIIPPLLLGNVEGMGSFAGLLPGLFGFNWLHEFSHAVIDQGGGPSRLP
jgi:hypothetical protein